jgi:AraC-like DNA-binding protein
MHDLKHRDSSVFGSAPFQGWEQRVGGFTRLPALIRQLGADPLPMLARVGLTAEALADREARIPYAALVALLQEAAHETACPHIGLLLGRMWHLSDVGSIGEAVRHSPSVHRALQVLVANQRVNSDGGLMFLIERGPSVDFGYAICHPAIVGANILYDTALAACVNFMRELCGPGWVPSEVLISNAKPDYVAHHRSLFKTLPHFSAGFCALRFPVEQLHMPTVDVDAKQWRTALQRLSTPRKPTLLPDVYHTVRLLLIDHRYHGDEVAHAMSMHRRTLNRWLQAQGTSFRGVLDDVRFQVARELLASDIALDDIAATLGYSTVTPFVRTFRRWSGTTPGRWRGQVREESSPGRPYNRPYSGTASTAARLAH